MRINAYISFANARALSSSDPAGESTITASDAEALEDDKRARHDHHSDDHEERDERRALRHAAVGGGEELVDGEEDHHPADDREDDAEHLRGRPEQVNGRE